MKAEATMKQQARRLLSCLRFSNSLRSTHLLTTRSLHTQVTRFPLYLSPFLSTRSSHHDALSVLRSQLKKQEEGIKSERARWPDSLTEFLMREPDSFSSQSEEEEGIKSERAWWTDSLTELLREQIADYFSSQSEAAGKNWLRPCYSLFRLLLKSCAKVNDMKEFWGVVEYVRKRVECIDEETFSVIYSELIKLERVDDAEEWKLFYQKMILGIAKKAVKLVAKNSDWGGELERKLGENSISVRENFVLGVVVGLGKKGLPLKALSFFKWVRESLGFEHNNFTYNCILRFLCREEAITEFWSMFKEMKDAGYVIDTDTYNCILRFLCRKEGITDFWSMFKEMKDAGYVIDTDTYVEVMREFRKRKMVKDAVELFEHRMDGPFQYLSNECSLLLRAIASTVDPDLDLMSRVVKKYEAAGYSLLKSDYEGIHRCLSSAGKFDEAEQIIRTMNRAGYKPSSIIHKQLIFGLCKAGRLEEACEVVDMMEAQGYIPDIKTWITLTKGYSDVNGVDKALPWFGILVKKGFNAYAGLLDLLVYGFLKDKRVIGAYELVMKMVGEAHMIPWDATFRNLIEELLGERRLEEALNLLRLMMKQDYRPYREPFVQYISKFGSVKDALVFLRALCKKQSKNGVPVLDCRRVFQSFFNEGRHSEAKELFRKCPNYIRREPEIEILFSSSGSSNVVAASA